MKILKTTKILKSIIEINIFLRKFIESPSQSGKIWWISENNELI